MRQIPGFYYDAERRRYFKIEADQTAPENAAWSADNVKRRRKKEADRAARRQAERRRQAAFAKAVKRSAALDEPPLVGGLIRRELFGASHGLARRRECPGRGERVDVPGAAAMMWAGGLKMRGSVRLWPEVSENKGAVSALWVGGDGKSGLGVVYAARNDKVVRSSYIATDRNGEINTHLAMAEHPGVVFDTVQEPCFPQVSSLSYHASSGRMFMTSRQPTMYPGIGFLKPRKGEGPTEPGWILGDLGYSLYGTTERPSRNCVVNTCVAAPANARLACAAGTNMGILRWMDNDLVHWLTAGWKRRKCKGSSHKPLEEPEVEEVETTGSEDITAAKAAQGEILALDFLPLNPAEIIVAGGRLSTVPIIDLRVPEAEWTALRHTSSVANLRAVGGYQVLAAGPKNAMALYDLRFLRKEEDKAPKAETVPIVRFAEYKNDAHMAIGLDVAVGPEVGIGCGWEGSGAGVVAAAHDDGRVAIYSLKDGMRLKSPAVDAIDVSLDPGGGPGSKHGVVKCLKFATMPGDGQPSLFVGERTLVNKYSLWEVDEW
ncbi:hypothetical protein QBC47DRAFT_221195 [Echria macrotheca]|uniref:Myocyte-specific enhancer factor 2d n=1 Tax=Echria macrotheca TaxID=438768 RepID=A0AAJ0BAA4_9PEZI|nr:hypothetical protein QBC47DRAFT_221195 [Echria macrotheca]